MITELEVSHYKSIGDAKLKLDNINVFVGKNGSGKSNIVDSISFLNDIVSEDIDYAITRRHGSDSVRQWTKFKPYNVSLQVRISNSDGYGLYKLTFSSSRNSYKIWEEVIEWHGKDMFNSGPFITNIIRDKSGNIGIISSYSDKDIDFDAIRSIKIDGSVSILSSRIRELSKISWIVGSLIAELRSVATFSIFPNTIRAPQVVSRARDLHHDGGNIASILKQLPADNRRKIIKALRVVMPQLENVLVRSAAGYYVPVFSVREDGQKGGHDLNMSQISDGTLRILGILTAFFQPHAPSKIIIEEPEQMIHPALLIVIRDAIVDFVSRNKNTQVFVTTHSATFMDLFDISSVVAVEYNGSSTICGPVSERQKKVVQSGLMTLGDVLLAEEIEIA
ncbi:AAA family ATPase [Sphingopyxis sp. Root1497]|uniref:AAA family ATPase n=1 Tax=Sphingopyxis sp. Root1497 TaxID=1736474 RepID=UPI000AA0CAEF|nr:AAA family ATPase [Sphingopyxis sp. Root1497]